MRRIYYALALVVSILVVPVYRTATVAETVAAAAGIATGRAVIIAVLSVIGLAVALLIAKR
jgi:hypothetical protein